MSEENVSVQMSDDAKSASTLSQFVAETQTKKDEVMVEAQRLINLYRQLSVLGDDFVPKFDAMLLSASPEVHLALSSLSSGDSVRTYLKFLQDKQGGHVATDEQAEEESETQQIEGYLPSPDDVTPFSFAQPVAPVAVEGGGVSADVLTVTLKTLIDNQEKRNALFQESLKEMKEIAAQKSTAVGEGGISFDLEQFQQGQRELLNQTVEKITSEQVKILNESLTEVLRNTQEIAQEQVKSLGQLILENRSMPISNYPTIEVVEEKPAPMMTASASVKTPEPTVKKKSESPAKQPEQPVRPEPAVMTPDIPTEEIEILSEPDDETPIF